MTYTFLLVSRITLVNKLTLTNYLIKDVMWDDF